MNLKKTNLCLEVRINITFGEKRGDKRLGQDAGVVSGMLIMFCFLIWLLVIWMFAKILKDGTFLIDVFFVCVLYCNKKISFQFHYYHLPQTPRLWWGRTR